MTYEEVVDYLVEIEGKEQVISITLGPGVVGAFPDPGVPSEPFLSVSGVAASTESEGGSTGTHAGRPRAAIKIGPSCQLDIPPDRMGRRGPPLNRTRDERAHDRPQGRAHPHPRCLDSS